jgi:hypothetical protein
MSYLDEYVWRRISGGCTGLFPAKAGPTGEASPIDLRANIESLTGETRSMWERGEPEIETSQTFR